MSSAWVIAAVAAVVGGVSAYRQGQAQQMQFEAAKQSDEFNAAIARQQAEQTYQAAGAKEDQQRRTNRVLEGKRAAAVAESGLGTGGSNADYERQQDVLSEMDALNIRYEGSLEATGLSNRAGADDWQGSWAGINRDYARTSTYVGTAGAVLSSVSSAYGRGTAGK